MFGAKYVNLQDILTLCPSLVNLTILGSSYLRLNANRLFDFLLPHFRNLIILDIYIFSGQTTNLSFIRYYVSLKIILLKNINIFNVDFVREIITLGTFKQLKLHQLKEHGRGALTIEAFRMLIGHCPFLECIAGVRSCPRLSSYRISQLRDEMKSHT
jgi:hypothetical protein